MTKLDDLADLGWCAFGYDAALHSWVSSVRPVAGAISQDPNWKAQWLRCGGTWFVGVNALPNDREGRVSGGSRLRGCALEFIEDRFDETGLDHAQISVIYPDYPQPMEGETAAAFKFRRDRDAAHVDGLLPVGPDRRRHLQEPHSYVLGLPLVETSIGASPMVVWEGSHILMQRAFTSVLKDVGPSEWKDIDLTETYKEARRHCFAQCRRTVVHAQPGEAYLIHRLALHGVAPWQAGAIAPPEGRMIAYFRPELTDISKWLA